MGSNTALFGITMFSAVFVYRVSILSKTHLQQTVLFTCEMMISYFIMLTVMTFNGWLFLAVLTGSAIGYTLCQVLSRRHASQIRDSLVGRRLVRLSAVPPSNATHFVEDTQPPLLDSRRSTSDPAEVESSLLERNGSVEVPTQEGKDEVEMILSSV